MWLAKTKSLALQLSIKSEKQRVRFGTTTFNKIEKQRVKFGTTTFNRKWKTKSKIWPYNFPSKVKSNTVQFAATAFNPKWFFVDRTT